MKRIFVVSFLFAAILLSPAFAVKSLVRLENLSTQDHKNLSKLNLDVAKAGKTFIEVVLDETQIKTIVKGKYKFSVIVPDLDQYVTKIIRSQTKEAKYFTYQTMTDALKNYASKFPKICRLESIGKSCEKRDIWALKISDNPEKNEKEPAACVMGAHHSREWISVEVPMGTIKTLIDGYGKDPEVTRLVNEREIWIIPMVNPDGVTYSQTKEKYWRKNRRQNSDGTYGVDPNRNYGYQWGNVGSSDYPNSDTYHGTGPFSEPETQAIRDLAKREHFQADISFHSYSELILWPWSYTGDEQCPHHDLFSKFGAEMAKFNGYTSEQSSELYPSMGDTDDFMYGELKSLSFTFELAQTFIPAPSEIEKINRLNVPAVLHMIDKSGTYGLITPAGEEAIKELSSRTMLDALTDLAPFASDDVVCSRIQSLQMETARRLIDEEHLGKTEIAQMVTAKSGSNPVIMTVVKLAERCRAFENLHTNPRFPAK